MAFDYINEAFKRLDILDEEMFDTSLNGINQLSDFMQTDYTDDSVKVIDPEVSEPEELNNSYVGKVIVNCNVCHSHVFENKEDITIGEDGTVNVETQCPYCGESEGFAIIGEIAPFNNDSEATEETPVDSEEPAIETDADITPEETQVETDTEDEVQTESMSRATQRVIQEDFKEVSITTEDQHMEMTSDENGKVTVTTEPVENQAAEEEMIVPVSDETQSEILDNNATEEPFEDELDFDFDEVDEESFNDLGESYLRKVYENVSSFKTTSCSANETALIVEGLIRFNSGVEKKTGFIFEAQDANSRGQLRFRGQNKHLSEAVDAFSLVGRVDNKKLFVESLKYNYNNNNQPVRGIVRRK